MSAPASASERRPARVANSEAELLTVARAVIGRASHPFVPLLRRRRKQITQIGPTAMALLRQTLARGVALALVRRGGWQRRQTLQGGAVVRGRLWERHRPLPPELLRFGPASFALLSWLHREDVVRPRNPLPRPEAVTLGDELLHYLAAERILEAEGELQQPAFREAPLCRLAFAHELPGGDPLPAVELASWVVGPGAVALEALQPSLARHWVAAERRKAKLRSIGRMIAMGEAQAEILATLVAAIEAESVDPPRRDLATFVPEAARQLLAPPDRAGPDERWWVELLDTRGRMARRQRAFCAAAALLRGAADLRRWIDAAGLVAHFDDGYEAAQALLSDWRPYHARPELPVDDGRTTPSVFERAAELATRLESLHSLGVRPADAQEPR